VPPDGEEKAAHPPVDVGPRSVMEEAEEDGEDGKDSVGELFLAAKHLRRAVEVAVMSSSTKPRKSVHGVEDRIDRFS
jgi:hypothetical protein